MSLSSTENPRNLDFRRSSQRISEADSSGQISPAVAVLLILAVLWCIVWCVHSWGYWEDDAFIHLEFARSLAAGRGFSFNGSVVYGDTAPLWVILLAAMHLLIPSWLVAGKLLASLGIAFTLPAAYVFSRRLTQAHPSGKLFSAAMVLLLVLNPFFVYWSFSGMETITAAGLAMWAVVAATSRPFSTRPFLLGCALAGIAPLLRPELSFFTAILALVLLYRRLRESGGESLLNKIATLATGFVLLCGPAIAWGIYAVHTFGRVIPNTNAAKRAVPGASVTLRLLNVYSLGFPVILLGLIIALIYLALHASDLKPRLNTLRNSSVFAAGGWIFVLWTVITLTFYVVNHTYVQTRYILVSAAGLTIVVLACLLTFSTRAYRLCLALALLAAVTISVLSVWPFIHNKALYIEVVRTQAQFLRSLPADAPVADYNIGEIAFLSEHPIIDTGGITRPGAIPFLSDPDGMVRWIHSQQGAYYVSELQPEPGAKLVYSQPFPYIGWSLNPRTYYLWGSLNLWKLAPLTETVPSDRP